MFRCFYVCVISLSLVSVLPSQEAPSAPDLQVNPLVIGAPRILTPVPSPTPAAPSIADHLLDAARSLRLAGRASAAEALQKEAEELMKPELDELQAKRAQREQLNNEIRALEESLRCPPAVSIRVQLCSVPSDVGKQLLPRGDFAALSSSEVEEFKEHMDKKLVRVLAETDLVTLSGKTGSLFNGGEFPIQLASGEQLGVQFREFGTRVEATPTCLGANRVRLELKVEHSTPKVSAGSEPPALDTRRLVTHLEVKIGETVLLCSPAGREQTQFLLVRVDPSQLPHP